MMAHERTFFAKMRRGGGNFREEPCATEALFSFEAVHFAGSRAEGTILEYLEGFLNFFLEQAFTLGLEVN